MYIKEIRLKNYRSYPSGNVKLVPGINVLYGDNGSGKTNILESVYWVSMIKSFRVSEDSVLVQEGKEDTLVEIDACDNDLDKSYSSSYNAKTRRRQLHENNTKFKKRAEEKKTGC